VGTAGAAGAGGGATGAIAIFLWHPANKMTPLKIRKKKRILGAGLFIVMDSS
jgi:hypothetical protein